jgi:hypothetical protein
VANRSSLTASCLGLAQPFRGSPQRRSSTASVILPSPFGAVLNHLRRSAHYSLFANGRLCHGGCPACNDYTQKHRNRLHKRDTPPGARCLLLSYAAVTGCSSPVRLRPAHARATYGPPGRCESRQHYGGRPYAPGTLQQTRLMVAALGRLLCHPMNAAGLVWS